MVVLILGADSVGFTDNQLREDAGRYPSSRSLVGRFVVSPV
jgi:hypothetical protein